MYLGNEHKNQSLEGNDGQAAFLLIKDPVAAIKKMQTIEDFVNYCHLHSIGMREQWLLINRHGAKNDLLTFGKALADYKEELGDTIYRLTGEKMTTSVHPDDVTSASSTETGTTSVHVPVETVFPTYCLTPYAASFDNTVWDNFLNTLMELGHIEPSAIAGFKNLLGIARNTGRYKPLKAPVAFASSKAILSFLISMMYGTFRYTLPCDVQVKNRVIHKGVYACKPLIVIPSGKGPDSLGRTRDAYWPVVQTSVVLAGSARRKSVEPVGPQQGEGVNSKHGFSTARKDKTAPEIAAPLIAMLTPLGCYRLEK